MLNHGLNNRLIPRFNSNLTHDFNHLMYADDLILVTSATRKAAWNINLCLAKYTYLFGQLPNFAKSQIFFPSWCNKYILNRICSILNLTPASYPFKYMGILISHRKIATNSFKPMVDKIHCTCNRWSNCSLSIAAKTILINSTLLSIPTYALSVYSIPKSILSKITKVVRKFF